MKITKFASQHKILSGIIIFIVILAGYFGNNYLNSLKGKETSYALAAVEKGTIVTSVSGSGQVSASNQLDIKPKVSGNVVYIGVKNGQEVAKGALLVQIDDTDAQKAVRDAEINLEDAQISLSKLQLSQNSDIPKLQYAIASAQNSLNQSYQNGFNEISNSFLDLPDIITGMRSILYDYTVKDNTQTNIEAYQDIIGKDNVPQFMPIKEQVIASFKAVSDKYDQTLSDYKNITRDSSPDQISTLINETLDTVRIMSQAVKDEQNVLDVVTSDIQQYQPPRAVPAIIVQYKSNISGYISKLNSHISSLANVQNSIASNGQSLINVQSDLEASQSNNPLDLASQENTVKQRQAALQDAKDNLVNYYVRAPFSGIVSAVNVKVGDSASGGGALATMITKQSVAEVSLNEVDIAKVKVGQKATITFDAVPGLTITGQVLEIDSLGTVSQGVVTYNVKIGFDTQDDRVRPGMSASAAIITDTKQNVLLVPNSAIKLLGANYYVDVPADPTTAKQIIANTANVSAGIILNPLPRQQAIEIGLANDSVTEITSGLNEGDLIVTRTITPTSGTQTSSSQNRSILPVSGSTNRSTGGFRGGF